ncbi:thioesterase family protein [[Mycobacterium] crassicus]|uniref:Thioesterase family protein n=1 Tax=[Mycobacterium] crassicus TaxID=2872309 RepID=A0ABU5XLU8_9MYCO|nr:thioesterase family protein [Mycolicibacter sp. MYC098]MEB3023242.1 thioesterase family protein [Mycolicibacter sp. MYC098]
MGAPAFYTQADLDVFDSSPLTAGPWGPHAQHAGPPSALLARQIERYQPRSGHRLARVTVDILTPVPIAPLRITVESIRQSRRVELLQATACAAERTVLIARAWRVATVAAELPALFSPDQFSPDHEMREVSGMEATAGDAAFPEGWHRDGYLSAIDWRFERGGFAEFGPARGWARSRAALVDGEPMTPWQRVLVVADSGSGISVCAPPSEHPAINCDVSVVLNRDPVGEWIGLDSRTTAVSGGGAMTQTTVFDQTGTAGLATQTLVVS